MDVAERSLSPAEETLQGLQGGRGHVPQDRQLPQPSRVQVPEQAHHFRHPLLGEAEGVSWTYQTPHQLKYASNEETERIA